MLPRTRKSFLLSVVVLLAGGCRSSEERHEREEVVAQKVREGDFEAALVHAERLAKANPRDQHLQDLQRDAQVALVLDRGRREVLRGELDSGLVLLERAAEIDPENPVVQSWIVKTQAQLAELWLDRAAGLTSPDQLAEAKQAYENVLSHDPKNKTAIRGYAHLLLVENYRSGQSQTYFNDGLSSFRLLELEQSRREFQVSRRYEENEPAALRADQVEAMIASERLQVAHDLEESGHFYAARNEYRMVLLVEPDNTDGRAGLDRMDREVRANREMAEADIQMRRGQIEQANESLQEAERLTTAQADDVSLLQSDVVDRQREDLYQKAHSLTEDYRYEDAVAAYDQLLAEAPDFKDASLRRSTLVEFIQLTEESYAKALAAKTDEEAEDALRAIQVIWPEYRDVSQRLADIEARKAGETPPAEDEPR